MFAFPVFCALALVVVSAFNAAKYGFFAGVATFFFGGLAIAGYFGVF